MCYHTYNSFASPILVSGSFCPRFWNNLERNCYVRQNYLFTPWHLLCLPYCTSYKKTQRNSFCVLCIELDRLNWLLQTMIYLFERSNHGGRAIPFIDKWLQWQGLSQAKARNLEIHRGLLLGSRGWSTWAIFHRFLQLYMAGSWIRNGAGGIEPLSS